MTSSLHPKMLGKNHKAIKPKHISPANKPYKHQFGVKGQHSGDISPSLSSGVDNKKNATGRKVEYCGYLSHHITAEIITINTTVIRLITHSKCIQGFHQCQAVATQNIVNVYVGSVDKCVQLRINLSTVWVPY